MSKRQRHSLFDEGLFLFTENLLPHSVQLAPRAHVLKSNRIIKEAAAHPAVRGRIEAVLREKDTGGAAGADFTAEHHRTAVGEVRGKVHIVGYRDNGKSLRGEFFQNISDRNGKMRVKTFGRFVKEQYPRLAGQRLGKREKLGFAAAQVVGMLVFQV